jgi:hypothetical protein
MKKEHSRGSSAPLDLAKKPDAGVRSVSLGPRVGDVQHLGGLLKRQAGDVSQFDQFGFGGVLLGQFHQRLTQIPQMMASPFHLLLH